MASLDAFEPLFGRGQLDARLLEQLLEDRRASNEEAGSSSGPASEKESWKQEGDDQSGAPLDPDITTGGVKKLLPQTDRGQNVETLGTDGVETLEKNGARSDAIANSKSGAFRTQGGKGDGRKPVSWLEDPLLKTTLVQTEQGPALFAFAKGRTVCLASLDSAGSIADKRSQDELKQVWMLDSKCEALESVTALSWVSGLESAGGGGSNCLQACLCLGTSLGYVRFIQVRVSSSKVESSLVLSQRCHRAPVLQLHLRPHSSGLAASDSLQELSLVFPGALVAIQASDLASCLRMEEPQERLGSAGSAMQEIGASDLTEGREATEVLIRRRKRQGEPVLGPQTRPGVNELQSQSLDEGALDSDSIETPPGKADDQTRKPPYLPFLKWRFASGGISVASGGISDGVIMGVRPGSLLGGYVEEPVYAVVIVAAKPFLAFYDAPIREEAESMLSRASGVATKVGSAVYSSASSVLSLGRTLQPTLGSKLFDKTIRQRLYGSEDGESEIGKEQTGQKKTDPGTDVNSSGTALQGLQKAVVENLGAAAASVNTAAANIVSAGPAGLGRQLAASVSARSASLGSLSTGLGLREKLRTSLGIKASRSLETVQSLDTTASAGKEEKDAQPEAPSDELRREERRAEESAERERVERMQGVPASLVGGLDDPPRKGLRVWMAPRGSLGAVSDSLGRVCLMDGLSGVVLRVWKGYRDAQCAWVAREQHEQAHLCLAIYAPRRGVLEVWPVPYGVKLATSDCGYGCRLLQSSVDLRATEVDGRDLPSTPLATACLLHPDGRIFTLKL